MPATLQPPPIECRPYEPADYWKSDVPAGRSGDWLVEHFELPVLEPAQAPAERTAAIADWARHRPGRYTRLRHVASKVDFMSDLHEEWHSQREPIRQGLARGGQVLVSGLGLGLIVECLLRPADSPVERVTVIERSPDVIRLVAGHLRARFGDRLEVIEADIFAWQPPEGARYSVIWHDIWPNPHTVPAGEIARLHARFEGVCDWQGSWDAACFREDEGKEVRRA